MNKEEIREKFIEFYWKEFWQLIEDPDLSPEIQIDLKGTHCNIHWNTWQSAIESQQAEIERLTKLITKSLGLLDVSLCPVCDTSGAYYNNYSEVVQCQWCHEVNEIKSALEGNQ